MTNSTPLLPISTNLRTTYLDQVTREGYCPGFRLWDVIASDGHRYLVAGDNPGGVENRIFFRTNGALTADVITLIGDNPAVAEWDALRGNSR